MCPDGSFVFFISRFATHFIQFYEKYEIEMVGAQSRDYWYDKQNKNDKRNIRDSEEVNLWKFWKLSLLNFWDMIGQVI